MDPRVFWNLTFAEYYRLKEGFISRMKREKSLMAWAVSHIINPHLKRQVSALELYNPDVTEEQVKQANAERLASELDLMTMTPAQKTMKAVEKIMENTKDG